MGDSLSYLDNLLSWTKVLFLYKIINDLNCAFDGHDKAHSTNSCAKYWLFLNILRLHKCLCSSVKIRISLR